MANVSVSDISDLASNTTNVTASRRDQLKTYHMLTEYYGSTNLSQAKYDPWIGIQTAGILGSCLLLVMAYVIYKSNCGRHHWTSTDRLFIDRYKQRLESKNNKNLYQVQQTAERRLIKQASVELTAHWIQTQPLHSPNLNNSHNNRLVGNRTPVSNSFQNRIPDHSRSALILNNSRPTANLTSALHSAKDLILPIHDLLDGKMGAEVLDKLDSCYSYSRTPSLGNSDFSLNDNRYMYQHNRDQPSGNAWSDNRRNSPTHRSDSPRPGNRRNSPTRRSDSPLSGNSLSISLNNKLVPSSEIANLASGASHENSRASADPTGD